MTDRAASGAGADVAAEVAQEVAATWIARWDAQQTRYIVDREERFAVIGDVVARGVGDAAAPVVLDIGRGPGSLAVLLGVDVDPLLLALGRARYGQRVRFMESVTVMRVTSWPSVPCQSGVLDLVNQVQHGEPYNYRPGEIPPPEDWFPALVDRSDVTLVACNRSGRPVGCCVELALTRYPDALAVAEELGVQPSETSYLAELGVCATARRRGIASLLLGRTLADPPAVTAWLGAVFLVWAVHGRPDSSDVEFGRLSALRVRLGPVDATVTIAVAILLH